MEISIATSFDYSIPIMTQLKLIARYGFSHVSIGGNYSHSGIQGGSVFGLAGAASDLGLRYDTVHGYNLDKPDALKVNAEVAKAASFLGAKVVVVHCSPFAFDPATLERRISVTLDKIRGLSEVADAAGVRFAFENVLPGVPTELAVFALENSDPNRFGFCYDSAHDQIDGPRGFTLLDRVAPRLIAVHISDRSGYEVDHQIPGEGFIDFMAITSRLRVVKPAFPLLMEVMATHSRYGGTGAFLAAAYREGAKLYKNIYGDNT